MCDEFIVVVSNGVQFRMLSTFTIPHSFCEWCEFETIKQLCRDNKSKQYWSNSSHAKNFLRKKIRDSLKFVWFNGKSCSIYSKNIDEPLMLAPYRKTDTGNGAMQSTNDLVFDGSVERENERLRSRCEWCNCKPKMESIWTKFSHCRCQQNTMQTLKKTTACNQ